MSLVSPPGAPPVAQATLELYNELGAVPSYGAGDAIAGYPLLRWLDGIGQITQRLNDLALDDLETGDPGWSILLDVNRCPAYALAWLAQCVGLRFSETQNTSTAQRAAISNAASAQRGTIAALQAAAAPYLNPGQQLVISERDTGPYHLGVTVATRTLGPANYAQLDTGYASYTALDGAFATYAAMSADYSEPLMQLALDGAKPAALIMAVTFVSGTTYSLVDGAFGTYSALDAAFATYAAIPYY